MFIPVNDNRSFQSGSTHWSLLVYLAEDHIFLHFDSSRNHNYDVALAVAEKFALVVGAEGPAEVTKVDCPQQENGYDCGMYVILNAHAFTSAFLEGNDPIEQIESTMKPSYVSQQRLCIHAILEELLSTVT